LAKTIMIFGAGINQLTLIEAARELGLTSVVIDPQETPPGKAKADFFYQVTGDDYQRTKEIAEKNNVDGIVTGQMENPLKIMARLAQEMGYIFHSPKVIERSTNKYLMKQAFLANGIPCAKGDLISNGKLLTEEELTKYSYPLIIKPLNAFSSKGVYRIDNYEDYTKIVSKTLEFSDNGSYLIEEFIDGPEYSVETITYHGETTIIQYTEKMITPYPNTVEIGHFQPAELSEVQKRNIDKIVKEAIFSLGIDNSAAHTEVKWSEKGPIVLEIGPRLGGDFIASYLTKASTGIDMDKAAIKVALGEKPDLRVTKNKGSVILYLTLPPFSVIKKISDNSLSEIPNLISYYLAIKDRDVISPLTDSAKRSGWVITGGTNRQEAEIAAECAIRRLRDSIELL